MGLVGTFSPPLILTKSPTMDSRHMDLSMACLWEAIWWGTLISLLLCWWTPCSPQKQGHSYFFIVLLDIYLALGLTFSVCLSVSVLFSMSGLLSTWSHFFLLKPKWIAISSTSWFLFLKHQLHHFSSLFTSVITMCTLCSTPYTIDVYVLYWYPL